MVRVRVRARVRVKVRVRVRLQGFRSGSWVLDQRAEAKSSDTYECAAFSSLSCI